VTVATAPVRAIGPIRPVAPQQPTTPNQKKTNESAQQEPQEPVPQDHYDPDDVKTYADVRSEDKVVTVRGRPFLVHFYRPVKEGEDEELASEPADGIPINLLIAKQRNGPANEDVNLTFLKAYTRFESAAKIQDSDVPQ